MAGHRNFKELRDELAGKVGEDRVAELERGAVEHYEAEIEQLHVRAVVPEHVESWVIRVCPVCRGLFEGENSWHTGDCPNRDRMWIPLEIPVVSYDGSMSARPEENRTGARAIGCYLAGEVYMTRHRDPFAVWVIAVLAFGVLGVGIITALNAIGVIAWMGDFSGFLGIVLGVLVLVGASCAVGRWG